MNTTTKAKLFRRDFTLVAIGQIVSLFGNAILRFALPLYLLRQTGSAALFGLVSACSFLPMIALSFLGGVLADRVNKRNIMVALDFFTALLVISVYLGLGRLSLVPLVLVALMLLYGISGTYQPAVQASIPALVEGEQVLRGGAVINQISSLSGLLGPIVGGMLFGAFGIFPILAISAACFFASAVMELFIRIPFTPREKGPGALSIVRADLRDSSRYIRREKPLLAKVILLVAAINLVMTSVMTVGLPVVVVDTLGMSDRMLGLFQGIGALGGLCGGLFVAAAGSRLTLRHSPRLLLLCSAFAGGLALPLLLGLSPAVGFWLITAFSFFIMALATVFSVQMMAAVQLETPPQLVGKVIALMIALSMCAQPLGQAIYGALFEQFPAGGGVILLAVAILSAGLSLLSRRIFADA